MPKHIERLATAVMDSDHPDVTAWHHRAAAFAAFKPSHIGHEGEAEHLLKAVHGHARLTDQPLSAAVALKVAARIAERAAAVTESQALEPRAATMRALTGATI